MTDKEKFAKDINVPRKEQIIIDGVDVSECNFLGEEGICNSDSYFCEGHTYCYYKQLAHKTQECEELKEYLQANQPTGICETCMATTLLQNNKYRKALKTIKEICLNDVYTFADGTQLRYDSLDDILDVINKLKEEL